MASTTTKLYCLLFTGIALASARETILYVHKAGLGSYESLMDVATSINASVTPAVIIIQDAQLFLTSIVQFQPGIDGVRIEGNGTKISCQTGVGGMKFVSVDNIQLYNFTLHGCGTEMNGGALTLENCTNVTAAHLSILYSKGNGLTLNNSYGQIGIVRVQVIGTTHKEGSGAGILVKFTNSKQTFRKRKPVSIMTFVQCVIENNESVDGEGGGMALSFEKTASPANISIVNCTFHNNRAAMGGGMYVTFKGHRANIIIHIQHCNFTENTANKSGGGLASVYFKKTSIHKIAIEGVLFADNRAAHGGGYSLFGVQATSKKPTPGETINFRKCTWHRNIAEFGTAVDISSNVYKVFSKGYLIIPQFVDCYFIDNSPTVDGSKTRSVSGTFVVSLFEVEFRGTVTFANNQHTALHTISGKARIYIGSHVIFTNNSGVRGGALAMYGYSQLYVQQNTLVEFINNSAVEEGGGIYHHTFDRRDFVSTNHERCFIQHHQDENASNAINITYHFENNTAKHGASIFAVTFHPCSIFWEKYKSSFHLDDPQSSARATSGIELAWNETQPFTVIPGQEKYLPISAIDEFNNEICPLYRVSVASAKPNSSIGLDREYTSVRLVRFWGRENEYGTLRISQSSFVEPTIEINVSVLPCPPGYISVSSQDKKESTCQCSADTDSRYDGIRNCNVSKFQAYVEKDYWVGVVNGELCTSQCPLEFCKYTGSDILLPQSESELSSSICEANRTGTLCAQCTTTLSVYFHSPSYKCGTTSHCHLSPLFYILSEILPMSILFVTIILLDVQFTSGAANGFIFFCQIVNTLTYRRGAHRVPSLVKKISYVYKFIYGIFNLEFFHTDSLSFCLWPKAKILDIIAFKSVTTVIAFLLIMSLVVAMNHCHCSALNRIKRKVSSKGGSVIHGLTTFLIISYTQCAKLSFQILVPVMLKGQGGKICGRVAYNGGMPYYGSEHRLTASLALVSTATVVSVPPIMLIAFPVYMRLLELCKLDGNKIMNRPYLKFKPLLDSIQSCFKDHLRFFAGVYLLYRMTLSACYSFSTNLYYFYATAELILIIMLAVHGVAQPYKCRVHNIVDSLLFLDLAVINGITTYFFTYPREDSKAIIFWFWIQMILLYLPLLFMCAYIVWKYARFIAATPPPAGQELSEFDASPVYRHFEDESSENNNDVPTEEFALNTMDTN